MRQNLHCQPHQNRLTILPRTQEARSRVIHHIQDLPIHVLGPLLELVLWLGDDPIRGHLLDQDHLYVGVS